MASNVIIMSEIHRFSFKESATWILIILAIILAITVVLKKLIDINIAVSFVNSIIYSITKIPGSLLNF